MEPRSGLREFFQRGMHRFWQRTNPTITVFGDAAPNRPLRLSVRYRDGWTLNRPLPKSSR